jgi:hypothetical protein
MHTQTIETNHHTRNTSTAGTTPANKNNNATNNSNHSSAGSNAGAGTQKFDPSGQIKMEDRLAMVRQILAESDYYRILGLERNCAQSEIRRAYISVSNNIVFVFFWYDNLFVVH